MSLRKSSGIRTRELENSELALLDAKDTQLILLNDVGAAVWDLCDGSLGEYEIAAALTAHFPQALESRVRGDVSDFVKRLIELKALEDR